MAPKKKGKGGGGAAPAAEAAAAPAAAAAETAGDAKSAPAKDDAKPKPWPMNPKGKKGGDDTSAAAAAAPAAAEPAAAAAEPAAAAAAAKPKAAATSMKIAKKAVVPSEPKNDLKEEDIDRQKLESALRRRNEIARGVQPASQPTVKIAADVAKAQRDKQRAWIASQEKELDELRDRTKKETEKNSDAALKVVIAVWILIIAGIFFHVYRTIEQGSRPQGGGPAVRNPNSADGSWTQRF